MVLRFGSADGKWAKCKLPNKRPAFKTIIVHITVTTLQAVQFKNKSYTTRHDLT